MRHRSIRNECAVAACLRYPAALPHPPALPRLATPCPRACVGLAAATVMRPAAPGCHSAAICCVLQSTRRADVAVTCKNWSCSVLAQQRVCQGEGKQGAQLTQGGAPLPHAEAQEAAARPAGLRRRPRRGCCAEARRASAPLPAQHRTGTPATGAGQCEQDARLCGRARSPGLPR